MSSAVSSTFGLKSFLLGVCLWLKFWGTHFSVIGPREPVVAILGQDIVLPCHLSPTMSAANMEVRWFRSEFSSFAHLYRDGMDQYKGQMPEYQRRTEFLKAGLTDGNVPLRILSVKHSDEGQYRCFVQADIFYGETILELKTAGLGSAPLISVEGHQDGGIRLVCRSAGWYPEPELLWKDPNGQHLPSLSETKSREENSEFAAETAIIVREQSNQNLSCYFRNTVLNQEKVSAVYIAEPFFPRVNPWMVALCLILVVFIVCFIGFIVYFFKMKGNYQREKSSAHKGFSSDNLKRTLNRDNLSDGKCVSWEYTRQDLPNNPERFDTAHCVLGREGFTSGRHCWEVEVGVGGCWSVGVAKESVQRKGWISYRPEEGIWAVGQSEDHFHSLMSPDTPLPVSPIPSRIRVCLDCDRGLVTFFGAGDEAPIFTFPPGSVAGERIQPWLWVVGTHLRLCP
uniref:Butyrophilin subfamily 1 member A1-like n=1 Tax=Pelusios castaneus TaxID=367368 RepID=A0A8C8SRQ7_9SAUR